MYILGQTALDESFHIVQRGDLRAQGLQVFENPKAALTTVGVDCIHVVKLNRYLVDMTQLSILFEVRDRYVNTQSTAITPVGSRGMKTGFR